MSTKLPQYVLIALLAFTLAIAQVRTSLAAYDGALEINECLMRPIVGGRFKITADWGCGCSGNRSTAQSSIDFHVFTRNLRRWAWSEQDAGHLWLDSWTPSGRQRNREFECSTAAKRPAVICLSPARSDCQSTQNLQILQAAGHTGHQLVVLVSVKFQGTHSLFKRRRIATICSKICHLYQRSYQTSIESRT